MIKVAMVEIKNGLVFEIKYDLYNFGRIYKEFQVKGSTVRDGEYVVGWLRLKFPRWGSKVKVVMTNGLGEEVLAELVFDNRSAMKVFKNWYEYTGMGRFWQLLEESFGEDLRWYLDRGGNGGT